MWKNCGFVWHFSEFLVPRQIPHIQAAVNSANGLSFVSAPPPAEMEVAAEATNDVNGTEAEEGKSAGELSTPDIRTQVQYVAQSTHTSREQIGSTRCGVDMYVSEPNIMQPRQSRTAFNERNGNVGDVWSGLRPISGVRRHVADVERLLHVLREWGWSTRQRTTDVTCDDTPAQQFMMTWSEGTMEGARAITV